MENISFVLQAEKIATILKTAKVDVEPFWPGLFAKCLESTNIKDLITNVSVICHKEYQN